MIVIEKLFLFNIKVFKKLYNKNYSDKDFFAIYDKGSFMLKYFLRKQVRLFKYNNKYIGYVWYDYSKKYSDFKNIYGLYFLEDFRDLIDYKILDFINCNIIKFDLAENYSTSKFMKKLGFDIYMKTYLMKLTVPKRFVKLGEGVTFKHFIKNCDEKLRCDVQNEIFYDENRVPLNAEDIFDEENQDYYVDDFSVFLYVSNECAGYGQIILSDNLYTIVNFGILKKYRCCGYGYTLLNYLIKLCSINNIDNVYIRVEKDNHNAISLYNKAGFKEHISYDTWFKCI